MAKGMSRKKLKVNEEISFAVFLIYFADIQFLIQD